MIDVIHLDCIYCGMPAQTRDHVIPHSYDALEGADRKFSKDKVVPACSECNSLLSNLFHITIADRAAYLRDKLAIRYRKVLNAPDWDHSDVAKLGRSLRSYIQRAQFKKKLVIARLSYLESTAKNVFLTPRVYWDSIEMGNDAPRTQIESEIGT